MILADDDGNVYKSDNVRLMNAQVHNVGREELYAEIMVSAQGFKIEMNEAETPPEMPLATVAAKATKIIQEEKYKAAIEEQWVNLTEMVCKAIKKGESYIHVNSLWMENETRLIEMGYEVSRVDLSHEWIIRWAKPFYLS
jgi:hypothetical protein